MRNKGYLKLYNNMGKPKKRVSPRIANHVNRDFERLILLSIVNVVRATNAPWEFDRSSMLGSTNRCGLCFHEDIPL